MKLDNIAPNKALTFILLSILLLCGFQKIASAQTPVTGSKNNQQQEMQLPADQTPAFAFRNDTGTEICDFVLTVHTGAANITGALLDDPNHAGEDWDVDDDRSGVLDAGESTAGAEPTPLTHAENTQPADKQIRIEERGMANCVPRNQNFELNLTFDVTPAAGDIIKLQPTNSRGRNIYAWVGDAQNEQEFYVLNDQQLKPTFAATVYEQGVLVNAVQLAMLTSGVHFMEINTTPAGKVDLKNGIVEFEDPVVIDEGLTVEASLSGFGVVSVVAKTVVQDTKPAGKKLYLILFILLLLIVGIIFYKFKR